MPVTAEETLNQLIAATKEAKATIRELHEARATALDVDRKQRDRITRAIVEEVEKQIGELRENVRQDMRAGVEAVISDINTTLTNRLGI